MKDCPTRTFNQEPSQNESRKNAQNWGDMDKHDGTRTVICIDKSDRHGFAVRKIEFCGCIERYRVLFDASVSWD